MGLARTPPPKPINHQTAPNISSTQSHIASQSPKKINNSLNKRLNSPSEVDPFKKKPKLIRSPNEKEINQKSETQLTSNQSELTTIKPSSIPIPINQNRSPKRPSTHPTQLLNTPITPQQEHSTPTKSNLKSNSPPPLQTNQIINSESNQIIKSNQIINPTPSSLTQKETNPIKITEDSSSSSTLSVEPPLRTTPLNLHPVTSHSPINSNIIKLPPLANDPSHQTSTISIEPLTLPPKLTNKHRQVEPPIFNEPKKQTTKSAGLKSTLKSNKVGKIATIPTDVQLVPKSNHSTSRRVSTPLQLNVTHDADLSRESNQTTEFGFTNIQFMEQRIQELEQVIKLMENQSLESQLTRQVDEAQLVWDREFESNKNEQELDKLKNHSKITSHRVQSNQFELEVKLLELKEVENQLAIKQFENRLLSDKFTQVLAEFQSRDQILLDELERLRLKNSEWAQIGHNFESLIEIERREKEELENRFQIELKQTKLEPNFEINNLKYKLIKSENRSELLEEQLQEFLDKNKNLETQLFAEKSQKNKLIRDLELSNLNVKSLSDQILDLTTALSAQQKGEGINQRSLSQDILNARAALAEKEFEITNLKSNLLSQPAPQKQQSKSINKKGLKTTRADKQVETSGVEEIAEQASELNELPVDDPIRQITAEHWTSIGVVAKKINQNRKKIPTPPITDQDVSTIERETTVSESQPLPLEKEDEKSAKSSKEKVLEISKDTDSQHQPEAQPVQATKKKVVKTRSKPTVSAQIPVELDNNDEADVDKNGDDDYEAHTKKKVPSSKPPRRGRTIKPIEPESTNDHIDEETNEVNHTEKLVDGSTKSKAVGARKGKSVEKPPVIDHQPVELVGSSLMIPSTNNQIGNLEGGSQIGSNYEEESSVGDQSSTQVKESLITSPSKVSSKHLSPQKIKKVKNSTTTTDVHLETPKGVEEEECDVSLDKVKKGKNKIKRQVKDKAKDKDKETVKEQKEEEEEEEEEEEKEQKEEEEEQEEEKPTEKKGKNKEKKNDKVKVQVKEKKQKKKKDKEKEEVEELNASDNNEDHVDDDINPEQVEHKNPSNQDQDESQPTTKTAVKRKKREVETIKKIKKKSKQLDLKQPMDTSNQGDENHDSTIDINERTDQDDGDSSFNKKNKKRKIFQVKQQSLNWTDDGENNMLGLPPTLSPIKQSSSHNNNKNINMNTNGFKNKKKISHILPLSLLS